MKKLFMTALIITTLSAQTVSINISGNTADYSNNPLESSIKVNQLVAGLWEYRSETTTDTNGDFSLTLDNVTSIESSNLLSFNYSLQGNVLTSPSKAEAEIIDYTILGEEASRIRIELSPGRNTIKNNLSNLSNGIYIRSIHLKEGIITQKIVKQGNTLNYGTAGINKLQINRSGKINLKKANSDSLYIMTIAEKAGFLSDTIITALSKDNPQDILGLNHRLKIDENQYNITLNLIELIGRELPEGITYQLELPDQTIDLIPQNQQLKIIIPKNYTKAYLHINANKDSLMNNASIITKKQLMGTVLAQTQYDTLNTWKVTPTLKLNLPELQQANKDTLALIHVKRWLNGINNISTPQGEETNTNTVDLQYMIKPSTLPGTIGIYKTTTTGTIESLYEGSTNWHWVLTNNGDTLNYVQPFICLTNNDTKEPITQTQLQTLEETIRQAQISTKLPHGYKLLNIANPIYINLPSGASSPELAEFLELTGGKNYMLLYIDSHNANGRVLEGGQIGHTNASINTTDIKRGISEFFGFQGNDRTNVGPWNRDLTLTSDIVVDSNKYGYIYNPFNFENVILNQMAYYLVNMPQMHRALYPIEKMSD